MKFILVFIILFPVFSFAQKVDKNIPESAILVSLEGWISMANNDYFFTYGLSGYYLMNCKLVFGFGYQHSDEISTLFITPLEKLKEYDLLYGRMFFRDSRIVNLIVSSGISYQQLNYRGNMINNQNFVFLQQTFESKYAEKIGVPFRVQFFLMKPNTGFIGIDFGLNINQIKITSYVGISLKKTF